jgi:hypothetical protein
MSVRAALGRLVDEIAPAPSPGSVLWVTVLHAQAADVAHDLVASIEAAHPGVNTFWLPSAQ